MAGDFISFNYMDDYSDSLLSAGKPFLQGARLISNMTSKRSITALSKDLIMQFPVLMSAGIDQDSAVTIAKALERMYASMYLTVWTADSAFGVDASLNGVRDFVKRYHNNDDIPDMITYGGNIDAISDLVKALCWLTATNYDEIGSLDSHCRKQHLDWGTWFEWGFFRVRVYKKGTAHFEFLDENVWARFNQEVAKTKGWHLGSQEQKVPQAYRIFW